MKRIVSHEFEEVKLTRVKFRMIPIKFSYCTGAINLARLHSILNPSDFLL